MTFFRQIALLLPSAFLLGVLLFLLTHGRTDPGFGSYPFFEQWIGPGVERWTPEARFLSQASVFFLPAYLAALLFVLGVVAAERVMFGRPAGDGRGPYRRSFGAAYSILFLAASGFLVFAGDSLSARHAPDALLAPLLVAVAPFAAAAVAVLPSAVLAAPLAALRKAGDA